MNRRINPAWKNAEYEEVLVTPSGMKELKGGKVVWKRLNPKKFIRTERRYSDPEGRNEITKWLTKEENQT